jgi:hypothetical protein
LLTFDLDNTEEWVGSMKTIEEINVSCSKGNISHTQPQLIQHAYAKLTKLTPDKLRYTVGACFLSPTAVDHITFAPMANLRLSELKFFFVQTTPDYSGTHSEQISYADAVRRMRVLHYDRGTIVNPMETEAKSMAECYKRFESFTKSAHFRGKVISYQLAQLGFFFVGDQKFPGKLRCSFCRHTIYMFSTYDILHVEKNWDRRLLELLQRHAYLAATCPFTLGVNGDDKRFSSDDMSRVVDSLIQTHAIQHADVKLNITPQIDSSHLRIRGASIISVSENGIPPLDGDMSIEYFNVLAELEYELHTQLELLPDSETDLSNIDELTLQITPIDYLIGDEPKYRNFLNLQSRIDSFNVNSWHQLPISRTESPFLKTESFAKAGFYYTGKTDLVMCFLCGLALNNWDVADCPETKHIQMFPRCTWLLRVLGRHQVKYTYLKADDTQTGAVSTAQHMKPLDYIFIKNVDDIAGIL